MPDLMQIFFRSWKFIIGLTVLAVLISWIVCLIVPKQYLSEATALPANNANADKARFFNKNIEGLYSEFGSPDDLDRFEGTAKLDTVYNATVKDLNLQKHYKIKSSKEALYKTALKLRKNSRVSKSAYGELKVKVWDRDKNMAALICNTLLSKIQFIHQQLRNESSILVLERLKENYANEWGRINKDTLPTPGDSSTLIQFDRKIQVEQLQQYQRLISEYELAVAINPPTLLTVEHAQVPVRHDKPKTLQVVIFTLVASLVFSILLAIFIESRKALV